MSRRENVLVCVCVSGVCRSTSSANPFSYSKTCFTFRTAGGNDSAARTSLGGVAFVDYLKDDIGLMALIFQHRLEHGPARIQRALGHLGFDQLDTGHVAHKNGGVVFHQYAAELVQLVFSLILILAWMGRGYAFSFSPAAQCPTPVRGCDSSGLRPCRQWTRSRIPSGPGRCPRRLCRARACLELAPSH